MKNKKNKATLNHNHTKMIKKGGFLFLTILFLFGILAFQPKEQEKVYTASAATATAVSFGTIDYENLTLQVYNNNNDIVYYSTDNVNWEELDATYNSTSSSYSMDISWVSATGDVTLYFKGDSAKTVKQISLPAQNTDFAAEYDKVENEFTFTSMDDANYFEWRNAADYYWNKVSFTESSGSYQTFKDTIECFRLKGAKIIIRIPQVMGSGAANVGSRPSTEIGITIPAQLSAPAVKVNSSRLTLNTTSTMEYYDTDSGLWMECDGTISLTDIAPSVLYENGAKAVTLSIRKEATTSSAYSKTQKLKIPAQAAPPTIGGNTYDVTYYYLNGKLVMQFNNASSSNVYEYTVIRGEADFSVETASWRSVSSTALMTLTSSAAPEGCTIYVRKKGTDENTYSNISLVLASAVNSFTVHY